MEGEEGEDLIAKFTDYLRTAGRSQYTLRGYPGTVRQFCRFVKDDLLEVTREDLGAYLGILRQRQFKSSTVKRNFTVLSQFYEFLIDDGIYTSPNPVTTSFRKRYLRAYKSASGERYCPTTDEVVKLIGSISNSRDLAIIVTLFKCGLRRKEICELDFTNVNLARQTLLLTPTAKRTNLRVFCDDETAYVLQRWLRRRETLNVNNSPTLFLTKGGARMSLQSIDILFRKYARAAGYTGTRIEEKLTPHCCRHWFSTELLEAGMSFEHVQWLRGDKGTSALNRYHHINPEKVKEEYLGCIPRFGLM